MSQLFASSRIDEVIFSYSDVAHQYVMEKASQVVALGADFRLIGSRESMLESKVPVVAVCAVRTGAGKSQTTRRIAQILRDLGKKTVVVRHPMPYGDLSAQVVQRFQTLEDLQSQQCTIEEMEEYEPHIRLGFTVYAGVDYGRILKQAQGEADVILWDGGNNDIPFYKPRLHITVADPHRQGNELSYFPGRINLIMADIVVISKVDAASPIFLEGAERISGKRVLVVEDGPTLTHGEMKYGAGVIAARKYGAAQIVDPRKFTSGTIRRTYETYPNIGRVLPAVGYGEQQIKDLEATINNVPCDLVIIATPVDLTRIVSIDKPMLKVNYELQEIGRPDLPELIEKHLNL